MDWYQDETGQENCKACGAGQVTRLVVLVGWLVGWFGLSQYSVVLPDTNLVSLYSCLLSLYSLLFSSPGGAGCSTCESWEYLNSGSQCTQCQGCVPGQFNPNGCPTPNQGACESCTPGFYKTQDDTNLDTNDATNSSATFHGHFDRTWTTSTGSRGAPNSLSSVLCFLVVFACTLFALLALCLHFGSTLFPLCFHFVSTL